MSARRDRFRDIVETLTRHGLGFALGYLGLDRLMAANGRPSAHRPAPTALHCPFASGWTLGDLEIMAELSKRAEQASATVAGLHAVALVDEFSQTMRTELDYLQEARNAERFARKFAGDIRVHIPQAFWDTTTSRVRTLERVRGTKINDAEALRQAGIDAGELAVEACNVLLKMVFEDGFFHADPHPGNFFVEADAGWASSTSARSGTSATHCAASWSGCSWPWWNRTPGGSLRPWCRCAVRRRRRIPPGCRQGWAGWWNAAPAGR